MTEAVERALARLARVVEEEGGLLAEVVIREGAAEPTPPYPFLVEAIREGYLQHYGRGRVLRPDDPDLALLAGDRLYALGLAQLADLEDLEATVVLADTISACAQAHAEGRPEAASDAWRRAEAAVLQGR